MLVCRRVRKPEEESQEETAKEEKEPALFLPQARVFRVVLAFQQVQHWLEVRFACRLDRADRVRRLLFGRLRGCGQSQVLLHDFPQGARRPLHFRVSARSEGSNLEGLSVHVWGPTRSGHFCITL